MNGLRPDSLAVPGRSGKHLPSGVELPDSRVLGRRGGEGDGDHVHPVIGKDGVEGLAQDVKERIVLHMT